MQKSLLDTYRIDRSSVVVKELAEPTNDWLFWQSRPPEERLQALELMRQMNYGVDSTTGRIQRILKVIELESS
jgi:hypothetical protein